VAYQPATNMTTDAGKAHLATVSYKRKALDTLKKMTWFLSGCEDDVLERRQGMTVQWWRPTLPGANTTPSSEGTVGAGLTSASTTVSATVSPYSDFYSISALLLETDIANTILYHTELLSYRGALSVDTIARLEFDSPTANDVDTLGATFTTGDIRLNNALLNGIDARGGPKGAADRLLIMHPYAVYDLKADNTAGGFIDIMKYANPQAFINGAPLPNEVGRIDNTRIVQTTNVKTSGTAPNVKYWNYLIGKGAVGAVDLAGSGPTRLTDPSKQAFNIRTLQPGPNPADPEGNIGAFVSYRFVFVVKELDSTNRRCRKIKADVSLV